MFTQRGPPKSAVVKKRVVDVEEAKDVQIPLIIPARTHWRGGARCEE